MKMLTLVLDIKQLAREFSFCFLHFILTRKIQKVELCNEMCFFGEEEEDLGMP